MIDWLHNYTWNNITAYFCLKKQLEYISCYFFTAMEGIQECSHEPIEMPTATSLSPVEFPSTDLVAIYECTPNAKMSG